MSDKHKIEVEELLDFWPMNKINDEGLALLADKVKIAVLPAGKLLIKKDKKLNARFYLLSGEIKLKSVYGHMKTLVAGDKEARKPVDTVLPELESAISSTQVKLMAIVPSDYEQLKKDHPRVKEWKLPDGLEHLAAMMAGENPIIDGFNKIFEDEEAEVALPEISPVAFDVLRRAADPDVEPREIGNIIDEDDKLSSKLIRIANSPQFMGSKRAFSCFEAVGRLGVKTTSSIIISTSLHLLFEGEDSKTEKLLNEAWARSIKVAADAFILAKYTETTVDPEDALLAGLLHEIGMVPICHFADDNKELLWKAKDLEAANLALKGRLGAMIIEHWGLDQEYIVVVEEVHNQHRTPDGDEADLCDYVQVARYYNAPASDPYSTKQLFPDLHSVHRVGVGPLTKEKKLEIIEENLDEQIAMCDALRG